MAKGITVTSQFVLFWGGWPSQFYPAAFVIAGTTYNCCEQYMMAEKARVFGDNDALAQIMAAKNPRDQKALGRKVCGFDVETWDSICRGVVYTGNLARFSQDQALAELLLATGEKTIIEASPTDRIWGIGLSQDDPRAADPVQWRGKNWLGIALMQVRDSLCRARKGDDAEPNDPELARQIERRRALGNVKV